MPSLERKIKIPVGPRRIVAAFFDPEDIRRWLGAGTSTAEPRDGGAYLLRWQAGGGNPPPPPGAGALSGTVQGYDLTSGFTLSSCRWIPDTGEVAGPFRLTVQVDSKINHSILRVGLDGLPAEGRGVEHVQRLGEAWTGWLENLRTYLESDPSS